MGGYKVDIRDTVTCQQVWEGSKQPALLLTAEAAKFMGTAAASMLVAREGRHLGPGARAKVQSIQA